MSNTKLLQGFVAGAGQGAVGWILFAPDIGAATCKYIVGHLDKDIDENRSNLSASVGDKILRQVMHKAKKI